MAMLPIVAFIYPHVNVNVKVKGMEAEKAMRCLGGQIISIVEKAEDIIEVKISLSVGAEPPFPFGPKDDEEMIEFRKLKSICDTKRKIMEQLHLGIAYLYQTEAEEGIDANI